MTPSVGSYADFRTAKPALQEWLANKLTGPNGLYVCSVEMGGGKTRLALEAATRLASTPVGRQLVGKVGFFVPRYEQIEQFGTLASPLARHKGAERLCIAPQQRKLAMVLDVQNGQTQERACGDCPMLRQGCPYWKQDSDASNASLHLYAMNHLVKPVLDTLDTIIVDDGCLARASVRPFHLSWAQVEAELKLAKSKKAGSKEKARALQALLGIREKLPKPRHEHDRPSLSGYALQKELQAALGGLAELGAALVAAKRVSLSRQLPQRGAQHRLIARVFSRLAKEMEHTDQFGNPMVVVTAQGVTLWRKRGLEKLLVGRDADGKPFAKKRIIVLNAGHQTKRILSHLFGIPVDSIEEFSARVPLSPGVHVTQVPTGARDSAKGVRRPLFSRKNWKTTALAAAERFERRQREHPEETPADWGFVGFNKCCRYLRRCFPGLRTAYYGNQAGSNTMNGVKLCVIAGNQQPHPATFLEEAQAVFGDAERLKLGTRQEAVTLRDKAGNTFVARVTVWEDPRLQALWEAVTVGEVYQAFGRSRPFCCEAGVTRDLEIIVLGSHSLPGILPDRLVDAAAELATGRDARNEAMLFNAGVAIVRRGDVLNVRALQNETGLSKRQVEKHTQTGLLTRISNEAARGGLSVKRRQVRKS
ncbi:hypothetical protein JST97_24220 [bacterium]|nr:hypothetical protein [bacterium]